jgi:SdrD B-like domain
VTTNMHQNRRVRTLALFVAVAAGLLPIIGNSNEASAAPATVTGTVFRDYNQSGSKEALEPGVGGVTVTAFDTANTAVGTATSNAVGAYSLTASTGGKLRLEFTAIPSYLGEGPQGSTSGTTEQFIDTAVSSSPSLGVANPADYCQSSARLALSCFTFGPAAGINGKTPSWGDNTAIHGINEDMSAGAPQSIAKQSQVGATWGLAYHRFSKTLFAASFMKNHAGFGPDGPAAIYKMAGSGTNTASLFVNLSAISTPNVAGADTHPTDLSSTQYASWNKDYASYGKPGEIGLGGLALDDNGHTLWTMNLATRELISMEIGSAAAPLTPTSFNKFPVPTWCETNGKGTTRPFAVSAHNNAIFVGGVCAGIAGATHAADLNPIAFVYRFAAGAYSTAPVLTQDLGYKRGCAAHDTAFNYPACVTTGGTGADYGPWKDTYTASSLHDFGGTVGFDIVEPMLTGITFVGEDMVLGIRNRDLLGSYSLNNPANPAQKNLLWPAGEFLRACSSTATLWAVESAAAGTCPGSFSRAAGNNPNFGPGAREFYWGDQLASNHEEAGAGGVVQIPGHQNLQTSMSDPTTSCSGGFASLRNTDGSRAAGFDLTPLDSCNDPTGRFGKSNAIGGIAALCDQAPIEIGNRVWSDDNADGLQTAGEPGIGGVVVKLVKGSTTVATTTTAADGSYKFNNANVTGGIIANANDYTIVIDNIAGTKQPSLSPFNPTISNAGGSANEAINSNVVASGNNSVFPVPATDIDAAGSNNHSYDFGFVRAKTNDSSSTTSESTTTTTRGTTPPTDKTSTTTPTTDKVTTTTTNGSTTTTTNGSTTTTRATTTTTSEKPNGPKGTFAPPPTEPPPPDVVVAKPVDIVVQSATVSNAGAEQPYVALPGNLLPFTD